MNKHIFVCGISRHQEKLYEIIEFGSSSEIQLKTENEWLQIEMCPSHRENLIKFKNS